MTIKLSDYVINFISEQGVKHVFMLPGGGAMHLIDSLGRTSQLEFVTPLHEQAAAIAAQAYAHFTSRLGAAVVTTGPGGTNTLTGVAAAWIDSTPCLFISGQAKRSTLIGDSGVRSMGSQEVDIISIVRPITKYAVRIMDPLTIRYHLEKAVFLARSGRRGPVWLDIPVDVQAIQIDPDSLERFSSATEFKGQDFALLQQQVGEIIGLINQAERPIILAGYGVQAAEAVDVFYELVDALHIPVLSTWKAIGLMPDDHPLFAGRPGSIGQRGANFSQQNSDLLLVIGARLDPDQIAFTPQNFARAATKIVVDVDPSEINKLKMDIRVKVISDALPFLHEMLRQRGHLEPKDRTQWINRCIEWKKKYPTVLPKYWQEKKYVNMYVLMQALSEVTEPGEVIVPGSSGPCANIMMQAWHVKEKQSFVFAPGLGAMGFGLPGSIGACLASGRRRTICVNGDGGFQLNIQELETIHRLQLPIKFFVLSNNGYGSIMAMQRNYFDGHYVGSEPSSGLTFPDIVKVARAYGLKTYRLKSHHLLRQKIQEVITTPGPVVCEVKVDPMQVQMPRVTSVIKSDGTMVSKPMEDLWPFLEREEFLSNMIIPPLPD